MVYDIKPDGSQQVRMSSIDKAMSYEDSGRQILKRNKKHTFACKSFSSCVQISMSCLVMMVFSSLSVYAETINATASATIEEPVSGVFSLSNFSVGMAAPETETQVEDGFTSPEDISGTATNNFGALLLQSTVISPARFVVFGVSNQVFSLGIPEMVSTTGTSGNNVTLGGFQHTAGIMPVMNSNGVASFSVGAFIMQLNEGPALSVSSSLNSIDEGRNNTGNTADNVTLTADESTSQTSDENNAGTLDRISSPFKFSPNDKGLLGVLISYN